ncbi:MAG TPA: thiamine-phosphate kinase [Spongiibacteraceae bacterium]|nr:thiamine-phosphate kinase [Spongiibacteraceae bacterium]
MARSDASIGEFELIAKYFAPLGNIANSETQSRINLGIGDDAALLNPRKDHQLAISVDTLVAGVHFPVGGDARLIAHKALRSNLSDLAAMAATPLAYTLALTLPALDEPWLANFSEGLREIAEEFQITLIGGDTTRGAQLVITIQIIGEVPTGKALTRSGAQPGDIIFVTGTLGDARAALDILAVPQDRATTEQQYLLDRYYRPTPRLSFAQTLRGIATAAIDISDGLAADLGHILKASGVGAEVRLMQLPLSDALLNLTNAHQYALSGGDDYELCFTAAPEHAEKIQALSTQAATRVTEIGRITENSGLVVRDINGKQIALTDTGYTHF